MSDDKARENRIRRRAYQQGLRLVRSRRRDRQSAEHGTYMLVDATTGAVVAAGLPDGYGMDLDAVDAFLSGTARQDVVPLA